MYDFTNEVATNLRTNLGDAADNHIKTIVNIADPNLLIPILLCLIIPGNLKEFPLFQHLSPSTCKSWQDLPPRAKQTLKFAILERLNDNADLSKLAQCLIDFNPKKETSTAQLVQLAKANTQTAYYSAVILSACARQGYGMKRDDSWALTYLAEAITIAGRIPEPANLIFAENIATTLVRVADGFEAYCKFQLLRASQYILAYKKDTTRAVDAKTKEHPDLAAAKKHYQLLFTALDAEILISVETHNYKRLSFIDTLYKTIQTKGHQQIVPSLAVIVNHVDELPYWILRARVYNKDAVNDPNVSMVKKLILFCCQNPNVRLRSFPTDVETLNNLPHREAYFSSAKSQLSIAAQTLIGKNLVSVCEDFIRAMIGRYPEDKLGIYRRILVTNELPMLKGVLQRDNDRKDLLDFYYDVIRRLCLPQEKIVIRVSTTSQAFRDEQEQSFLKLVKDENLIFPADLKQELFTLFKEKPAVVAPPSPVPAAAQPRASSETKRTEADELRDYKEICAQLIAENEQLRARNTALENANKSMVEQNSSLSARLTDQTQELGKLRQQVAASKNKFSLIAKMANDETAVTDSSASTLGAEDSTLGKLPTLRH